MELPEMHDSVEKMLEALHLLEVQAVTMERLEQAAARHDAALERIDKVTERIDATTARLVELLDTSSA